jgi:methionyl-tRNA formyltransferase
MNIVLVGEESAGIQTLRALKQSAHRLVLVLASSSKASSSGASVWSAATKAGIPVWPAEMVKEPQLGNTLREMNVDILLNVHSLYVIHAEVLKAASAGAFNLHPGPLPRYAGLNAVSWAIYRGETVHGVTLHKMVPDIDAGPIVYQSLFPINQNDTALSLSAKCVKEGLVLIEKLLDSVASMGSPIPLREQDLAERQYFGKEIPEGGRLTWSWPATRIVNFVRACDYFPFHSPWGYPLTELGITEIAIAKASKTGSPCDVTPGTVGDRRDSGILVAGRDEWVLIKTLKIGKRYLPADHVLRQGQVLGRAPTLVRQ